jgi:hypothetical protein
VRRAVGLKPAWLSLLERLPAELAPTAAAVRSALQKDAPGGSSGSI